MINKRIKIGVSSCLLGRNVRYDGGHRQNDLIMTELSESFELIGVCPELEAGFGVPREPVQLTLVENEIRVLGRESGKDCTEQLSSCIIELVASEQISSLSGFILKSKSPSCGGDRVKLFGTGDEYVRAGVGLFAKALSEKFPELPTIDEKQLADQLKCERFISQVVAYHENHSA